MWFQQDGGSRKFWMRGTALSLRHYFKRRKKRYRTRKSEAWPGHHEDSICSILISFWWQMKNRMYETLLDSAEVLITRLRMLLWKIEILLIYFRQTANHSFATVLTSLLTVVPVLQKYCKCLLKLFFNRYVILVFSPRIQIFSI